jgi:hypothetical protein
MDKRGCFLREGDYKEGIRILRHACAFCSQVWGGGQVIYFQDETQHSRTVAIAIASACVIRGYRQGNPEYRNHKI